MTNLAWFFVCRKGFCCFIANSTYKGGRAMAHTLPESIRSSATAGERILFHTLKHYLPDDYIVYYEPEIRGKRPDFVILGPDIGIIILEVKDYRPATLIQVNQDEWLINSQDGQKKVISPLKQARGYMFHLMDALKKDSSLLQIDGKYASQLKFPCGHGVVFTRMTQHQFIEHDLYSVIEPNFCLTRDEIDPDHEQFSIENFTEKILGMFTIPFRLKDPMSKEDIQRIRYHLFPEVRISAEYKPRVPYQDQLLLSLHDIKTMDLHQEKLAKQIGDKNRLIRGVAGSGKTLILASRAKILAKEHPDWKILILCYNISLARSIEQMVTHMMNEPEDLFDFDFTSDKGVKHRTHSIQVRNFHSFVTKDLKLQFDNLPVMTEMLKNGQAILPKYDAIMIDEGQDFEGEWYRFVSQLLNPDTMSLLLVEDRAQTIYKRKKSYLEDIGMSFQGRSKVLSINYRNTAQIVRFAWDFYQRFSLFKKKVVRRELEGEIIAPQSTRRNGMEPLIVRCPNFFEEARKVAVHIQMLHENYKVAYEDMLILYRVKYANGIDYMGILQRALKQQGIPFYWIAENDRTKRAFERDQPTVKISTIDSSKGLDFQAVFMVGMHEMPFKYEEDEEKEVSRFYIGMTRAQSYLCLYYSGDSPYTHYLEEVLQLREIEKQQQQQKNS